MRKAWKPAARNRVISSAVSIPLRSHEPRRRKPGRQVKRDFEFHRKGTEVRLLTPMVAVQVKNPIQLCGGMHLAKNVQLQCVCQGGKLAKLQVSQGAAINRIASARWRASSNWNSSTRSPFADRKVTGAGSHLQMRRLP